MRQDTGPVFAKLRELIRRELRRRGYLPREVTVTAAGNNVLAIEVLLLNGKQASLREKVQQFQSYYEQGRLNAIVGPLVNKLAAELRTSEGRY
jgi:hypothetical protein